MNPYEPCYSESCIRTDKSVDEEAILTQEKIHMHVSGSAHRMHLRKRTPPSRNTLAAYLIAALASVMHGLMIVWYLTNRMQRWKPSSRYNSCIEVRLGMHSESTRHADSLALLHTCTYCMYSTEYHAPIGRISLPSYRNEKRPTALYSSPPIYVHKVCTDLQLGVLPPSGLCQV